MANKLKLICLNRKKFRTRQSDVPEIEWWNIRIFQFNGYVMYHNDWVLSPHILKSIRWLWDWIYGMFLLVSFNYISLIYMRDAQIMNDHVPYSIIKKWYWLLRLVWSQKLIFVPFKGEEKIDAFCVTDHLFFGRLSGNTIYNLVCLHGWIFYLGI